MSGAAWPWIALALLGAVHGLNPGMGWLFAVALGVQRAERRAVWLSLAPLAVGHALAIGAALAVASTIGFVVSPHALRWIIAISLIALGVRQLRRHTHPRAGGMRVTMRELVVWSFLVATAHGAGLMALPFADGAHAMSHAMHHATSTSVTTRALLATLVHSAGFLLVTGVLAVIVYERAGVGFLRRAWVNIDLLWAGALVVAAMAMVVL